MMKNYCEQLSTHSPLPFTIYGARYTKYAGKTHKTGKLPTNSHFRSLELDLLLYCIITVLRWKQETAQESYLTKQQKPLIQSDLCSYFSVLHCCGVHRVSDPSLLTEAATVDTVSANSLLLWCSAIKASSCFLLCRNSSLKISCLLISDHNCLP